MNVKEMQAAAVMQLQLISKELEIVEKPDSYTLLYFLNLSQLQYIITNFLNKGQVSDNIEVHYCLHVMPMQLYFFGEQED